MKFIRHESSSFFTLIELMVVISIIALLITLLMPALKQARESAVKTFCMSNQKQIGIATFGYVDDYNGYLPTGADYHWVPLLVNTGCISVTPDYKGAASYGALMPVAWDSIKGPFLCPATRPLVESENPMVTSYRPTSRWRENTWNALGSIPSRWGGWELFDDADGLYKKLMQVTPGSVILSEREIDFDRWSMRLPFPGNNLPGRTSYYSFMSGNIQCAPAWRHNAKSGNFLFYDGHVEGHNYTGSILFDENWRPYD